jgi:tripartite-type tricarboxylate transporter receptor subunit TctC
MSGAETKSGLRISLLLVALAIALASSLRAGGYPDHSVKVIVPFPPGGATDIVGRIVLQKLSERLGQQFFIENIAGAGGNIGMTAAARAPHDGYTVLLASSSIAVNPSLYKSIPFEVEKDFIPVTKVGASPNSWEVNSQFPARTMQELVALMKANPGKYSVASPGAGTTPSLASRCSSRRLASASSPCRSLVADPWPNHCLAVSRQSAAMPSVPRWP